MEDDILDLDGELGGDADPAVDGEDEESETGKLPGALDDEEGVEEEV